MQINPDHVIASRHEADGSQPLQAVNAASGEALAPVFHEATTDAVDRACRAAAEAAPAWRALSLERRAAFLETVAEELDASVEAFVERAPAETGLPEARIRGELGRTSGQLRLFATVVRAGDFLGARIDHGDPDRSPAPKPDVRSCLVPLGPVAVFGASNFPLAFSTTGGDTASAWAAGCPVVVKGHPGHPGTAAITAEAVMRAVARCEVPPGVFSLLHGGGHELGGALVQHPAIKAVGFTGSFGGGTALARLAATRPEPIPVYAEMGSVNPMFVMPAAAAERAESLGSGLAGSVGLGCGQFCTNPGLVFGVAGDDFERFVKAAGDAVAGAAPGVMLHGGILEAYEAGVRRLESVPGVTEVACGESGDGRASVRLFRTDYETFRANPQLAEEVFGPVSLLVTVDSEADLSVAALGLPGQLTATIQATDAEMVDHAELVAALEARAGRVLVNGFPTGVEVSHSMVHGGPYPATTDSRTTSVGTRAIERFLRPVCYQDFPAGALPEALRDDNPLGLRRFVDGQWQS
ncbi:Alpha-ketoglutaric semialdehyde dehydrogenase [wastewater metagenome]|uniref:Alpha-ketoglutaric semialdehyde dehydrogenase n=2 Tax=unclassified sequences TaxID=12908 RepID=A0A5B8RGG3_9ZZZZ|nr:MULTISPECIES: aldehyde dehydrogenase (NADP(+)) [Arhodomonas]MCS4503080.1 aldehyde dehydrogenase (NADP(+)) [Arhodomonas aquaeolei]QEA05945.1 alpha-ketoglutaric semialdehyde dehydrogenase [uncultured organism]